MTEPIRVAHVITDLMTGGAETMLYRLLAAGDQAGFQSTVISLKQTHPVGDQISSLGIPVRALGMQRWPSPLKMLKLGKWLKEFRPHVVQTWLPHSDLLGGVAARLSGRAQVVWGIHFGKLDPRTHGRLAVWTSEFNAQLSARLPAKIVCCSQTSERELVALGYDRQKLLFIPNGFDLREFAPDGKARAAVRAEFKLPADAKLIVHVGRFHPQKDYPTLMRALHQLMAEHPTARALLCGRGVSQENRALADTVPPYGDRILLLGERSDVRRLMAAADVFCSSSQNGEAFPLVLGEAMAAGTPCVTTDCGDAAFLVGDTGRVVIPRSPQALAAALVDILQLAPDERAALGRKARARIENHFSLQRACESYQSLYRDLSLVRQI